MTNNIAVGKKKVVPLYIILEKPEDFLCAGFFSLLVLAIQLP
jgi:hypothetical protein